MSKKIAIAGDHAGFEYKTKLKEFLESKGYTVQDFGPHSKDSVDYPDFVHPAMESIENGTNEMGILICGSGNGVNMTANKHSGIRSALCWNTDLAALCRQHNDANVICFAERFISYHYVQQMAEIFLTTEFEGGRHQNRVNKISC